MATVARDARSPALLAAPHTVSSHRHVFTSINALDREGLFVTSRRNLLKASLASIAGLSVPGLLRQQAAAREAGRPLSAIENGRPIAELI
jgi:hypothetical protein